MGNSWFKKYLKTLPVLFLIAALFHDEITTFVLKPFVKESANDLEEPHKIIENKGTINIDKFIDNREIPQLLRDLKESSKERILLEKAFSCMGEPSVNEVACNYEHLDEEHKIELLKKIGLAAIVSDINKYDNLYISEDIEPFVNIYMENNLLEVAVQKDMQSYALGIPTDEEYITLNPGEFTDYALSDYYVNYVYQLQNVEDFEELYKSHNVSLNHLEEVVKKLLVGQLEIFMVNNNDEDEIVPAYSYMPTIDEDYLGKYRSENSELISSLEIINVLSYVKTMNDCSQDATIKVLVKELSDGTEEQVGYKLVEPDGREVIIEDNIYISMIDDAYFVGEALLEENVEFTDEQYAAIERLRSFSNKEDIKINAKF